MPLNEGVRLCVGFLLDDGTENDRHFHRPVGTFFAIQLSDDLWQGPVQHYTDVYMVTARHVMEGRSSLEARMRNVNGEVDSWSVPNDLWRFPPDFEQDLAVAAMRSPNRPPWSVHAIPTAEAWGLLGQDYEGVPVPQPRLGAPIYYVGLWGTSERMVEAAIPVVRQGTIAAEHESHIEWFTESALGDDRWTFEEAHLVDVRSRGGFSGSPVFNEVSFPGPQRRSIPERWKRMLTREGPLQLDSTDELGSMWTLVSWYGMFVGHADESSIGVVIPANRIVQFLQRLGEADETEGP